MYQYILKHREIDYGPNQGKDGRVRSRGGGGVACLVQWIVDGRSIGRAGVCGCSGAFLPCGSGRSPSGYGIDGTVLSSVVHTHGDLVELERKHPD